MKNPFKRANQTTKKPIVSPEPVQHFDSEEPEAVICCMSCREPLWNILVRHKNRKIISTRILPAGKNSSGLSEDDIECPICGMPYCRVVGKDRKMLIRSAMTNKEFIA